MQYWWNDAHRGKPKYM